MSPVLRHPLSHLKSYKLRAGLGTLQVQAWVPVQTLLPNPQLGQTEL